LLLQHTPGLQHTRECSQAFEACHPTLGHNADLKTLLRVFALCLTHVLQNLVHLAATLRAGPRAWGTAKPLLLLLLLLL
jgi:hypothetical protein